MREESPNRRKTNEKGGFVLRRVAKKDQGFKTKEGGENRDKRAPLT